MGSLGGVAGCCKRCCDHGMTWCQSRRGGAGRLSRSDFGKAVGGRRPLATRRAASTLGRMLEPWLPEATAALGTDSASISAGCTSFAGTSSGWRLGWKHGFSNGIGRTHARAEVGALFVRQRRREVAVGTSIVKIERSDHSAAGRSRLLAAWDASINVAVGALGGRVAGAAGDGSTAGTAAFGILVEALGAHAFALWCAWDICVGHGWHAGGSRPGWSRRPCRRARWSQGL